MSERSNRRIERLAADCEKFKRQVASMRAEEDRFGDAVAELSRLTTPRPLSELTEADGEVLWWRADPHEGVRPDWPPPRPEGVVELEGPRVTFESAELTDGEFNTP